MHRSLSSRSSIRRLLEQGFVARDIGEALVSFDRETPSAHVRPVMEREDFDVVGVRDEGVVVGFVAREDLADGSCGEAIRFFGSDQLVEDDTPLRRVVTMLDKHDRVFVKVLGDAGGIITRTDLQKAPVRTWLFGLITIVEDALTKLIAIAWPDGRWRELLSEGRLALAERLLEERRRRGQAVGLLDCLQFADKAHIVFRDERLRQRLGIESSNRARTVIKNMERLRNALAHAQDLVDDNWSTIVKLSWQLDDVLDRLERLFDHPPSTTAAACVDDS